MGYQSRMRWQHRYTAQLGLAALCVGLLYGCKAKPWPEGPPKTFDERLADETWSSRCAECHGKFGVGDGPQAKLLKVKPRDFTDPSWQAEELDAELEAVILLGGEAMGYSAEMPANPDLNKHPAVAPLLVRKIRSLNRARAR